MPTNSVQYLYSDYRTATSYSPDYTLDFFSRNTLAFNNLKTFNDGDDLKLYVEMVYQYLNALYQKDRYNETADTADKHLKIIDGEISRLNLISIKDDWYYGVLSFKAMATYQLRDYKTSTVIFKQLAEHDPKNENYKKWLNYSLYGTRKWIINIISISCFILLALDIFFDKYISSFIVRVSITVSIVILSFGIGFYDLYIKRSMRKLKGK